MTDTCDPAGVRGHDGPPVVDATGSYKLTEVWGVNTAMTPSLSRGILTIALEPICSQPFGVQQCRTALRAVFLGTECRATLYCNGFFQ